jgi:nucleoid-associated protein YgaU
MSLQVKYGPVINLIKDLNLQSFQIQEDQGKLKLSGLANTPYEKNIIWDKIKETGGESPNDITADIKVTNTDFYHVHKVQSGESLSKIAKHYYKDGNKYMQIFEANKDQLKNPDQIQPGQQLKIPKP